jgi:hypothetical protein
LTGQQLIALLGAAGGAVAILTFFVGDATLARTWSALAGRFGRRIRWEEAPNLEGRRVRARLSHGYEDGRRLTYAFVIVPQRLALRALWRVFHPRSGLPEWIIAASFFEHDQGVELPKGPLLVLDKELDKTVSLPTWKLWAYPAEVDPAERKLVLIVRFTRRHFTLARRVRT